MKVYFYEDDLRTLNEVADGKKDMAIVFAYKSSKQRHSPCWEAAIHTQRAEKTAFLVRWRHFVSAVKRAWEAFKQSA